jgi:isopentenyl diphosphate isomerase/L-lactate dehydrogenase-like FMN-dependent dehydrogenase
MEKRDAWRAGERGISPRALAATATYETPATPPERTTRRRSQALYEHACAHFEKLEKMGVLRLSKEDGAWIIEIDGARFIGVGWRTLILVTEKLGAVANNSDRGVLLARQGENV